MTDTREGRIYKIVCSKSNAVYVGSTFNQLRTRMAQHHSQFKHGSGLAIYPSFKQHEWKSLKMILIETYQVIDRKHMMMYETLWVNKLKAINKQTPFQPMRHYAKAMKRAKKAETDLEEIRRKAWYAERKRISREYKSPYKLPPGTAELVKAETDSIIMKAMKLYRLMPFQEVIDRDIEILKSRK